MRRGWIWGRSIKLIRLIKNTCIITGQSVMSQPTVSLLMYLPFCLSSCTATFALSLFKFHSHPLMLFISLFIYHRLPQSHSFTHWYYVAKQLLTSAFFLHQWYWYWSFCFKTCPGIGLQPQSTEDIIFSDPSLSLLVRVHVSLHDVLQSGRFDLSQSRRNL